MVMLKQLLDAVLARYPSVLGFCLVEFNRLANKDDDFLHLFIEGCLAIFQLGDGDAIGFAHEQELDVFPVCFLRQNLRYRL